MNDERYVVVRTVNGHTWATRPHGKQMALDLFHDIATTVGSAYAPHTGNRVRVMAVDEWARLQVKAARR